MVFATLLLGKKTKFLVFWPFPWILCIVFYHKRPQIMLLMYVALGAFLGGVILFSIANSMSNRTTDE